jgi:hypothetical protein
MAIEIAGAKVGMLVQALPKDAGSNNVAAYKKADAGKAITYFKTETIIGKISQIDTVNNRVRVLLKIKLIERKVIKHSFLWIDPKDLLVVPVKTTLPTNVAEMKSMYVVSGKSNVNVRSSPINGSVMAKVNGNQMVRVTGQAKQGFTEVVTDNGNGWIKTSFLTVTKPSTVVTQPQPEVTQGGGTTPQDPVTPGVIYVPVEKQSDSSSTVITVALSLLAAFGIYKLATHKSKSL